MRKNVRSILLMVLVGVCILAFNMTSLADEGIPVDGPNFYKKADLAVAVPKDSEDDISTNNNLEDVISPRIASDFGWYSVTAYPCDLNKHEYYYNTYETYHNPTGRGSTAEFKVSQATKDVYNRNNCNGWYIVAEVNVKGVYWTEIKANGTIIKTDNSLQNMYKVKTYSFELPAHGNYDRAPFVIYAHDLTSQVSYVNGYFVYN